eukprot:4102573-Prymnesium_polylepis.1
MCRVGVRRASRVVDFVRKHPRLLRRQAQQRAKLSLVADTWDAYQTAPARDGSGGSAPAPTRHR